MVGGVAFCILFVVIGRAFFVRDGAKAFDLVAWGLRLAALAKVAEHAGKPLDSLRFLPVTSRDSSTVAVIDPADARVVGFLAFDGFF